MFINCINVFTLKVMLLLKESVKQENMLKYFLFHFF